MNRSAALARLEGAYGRAPRKSHSNFMSMSDDEDDDSLAASRRPSIDRGADRRLSVVSASNIQVLAIVSSGDMKVEPFSSDLLITPSPQQSKMASAKGRHRSRTTDSWFPPLANFIDLKNEEDPPNWGSFIEFSAAAA